MSREDDEEHDPVLHTALAARTRHVCCGTIDSLGPPDLCYIEKEYTPSSRSSLVGGLLGNSETSNSAAPTMPARGHYHHVLGLDMSSTAPVATYVANLAATQEPASWLSAGSWRIASATYCCWDAFSGDDLRVKVTIPGGVHVSILRPDGRGSCVEAAVSAESWHRVALSATLRALTTPPRVQCLRILPPSPAPEEELLESARVLLLSLGSTPTPESGLPPHTGSSAWRKADTLAEALFTYFAQSHRFEQAIAFFAPLSSGSSRMGRACGEFAAAAQRELGMHPEAIVFIGGLLQECPTDAGLLIAQGEILLQCHMLPHAEQIALLAVQSCPLRRDGWLLLARAQISARRHVEALHTLNAMPRLLLKARPRAKVAPLALGDGISSDPANSQSAVGGSETDERVDLLATVRGCHEGQMGGVGAARSDDRQEGESVEAAYTMLAELAQELGWEGLLDLRSRAFAMATDGDTNDNSLFDGELSDRPVSRDAIRSEDGAHAGVADPSLEQAEAAAAPPQGACTSATGSTSRSVSASCQQKPMCHRWLDAIFAQLHLDLVAFESWMEEEEEHRAHPNAEPRRSFDAPASQRALPSSRNAFEGGRQTGPGGTDSGLAANDMCSLWLSRARLAERLRRSQNALAAYTRAVQALEELLDGGDAHDPAQGAVREAAEVQWTLACTTLMKLHAEGGEGASVAEALAAAHRLLEECGSILPAGPDGPVAPREITACMYRLIAEHGLQQIRASQRAIGEPHAAMNRIFHEVVQLRARGYNT